MPVHDSGDEEQEFAADTQFWLLFVVLFAMLTLVAIGVGVSQRDAPPPFTPLITPTTYGPPPWP